MRLRQTVLLAVATWTTSRPLERRVPEPREAPGPPAAIAWCAPGLEAVAGDGCYAAPERVTGGAPLVVYLHGLFERGPQEDEERDRQRRVARLAVARGFALLALRGPEDSCRRERSPSHTICWPSNEATAGRAAGVVESWGPSLAAATERSAFTRKFLLGFSSGGYFTGLVAERDLWDADAFAIAHAGPVEPVRAPQRRPPLLLLSAEEDGARASMLRLDEELTREEWPHEHVVRAGGHALPDADIEAALAFFRKVESERAPPATRARAAAPLLPEVDAGEPVPLDAAATDAEDLDVDLDRAAPGLHEEP